VTLVDANGQATSGDLSGYAFTLNGASAYVTGPTNAQGVTSVTVPAGNYTISAQQHAGTSMRSFSVAGAASGTIPVSPGQATTVIATSQTTATGTTQGAAPSPTPGATPGAATAATQAISLSAGCTNVALTWPAGTSVSTVVASLSAPGAVTALWRYNAESATFLGFSPGAAAVSDFKATARPLEAVFICLTSPATLNRPLMS